MGSRSLYHPNCSPPSESMKQKLLLPKHNKQLTAKTPVGAMPIKLSAWYDVNLHTFITPENISL